MRRSRFPILRLWAKSYGRLCLYRTAPLMAGASIGAGGAALVLHYTPSIALLAVLFVVPLLTGTAWAAHDLWRVYRVWRLVHDHYFGDHHAPR